MRTATGLDTVSARLLRECFHLISDSLAVTFNRSIETSIFPDEWKSARITHLYKKCGNRNDTSNYQPISIIPVVAKVFERIVYATGCYKGLQGVKNDYKGLQKGYRGLPGVTKGYKGLQGGYKGLEKVTKGYKRLQRLQKGYKSLQGVKKG